MAESLQNTPQNYTKLIDIQTSWGDMAVHHSPYLWLWMAMAQNSGSSEPKELATSSFKRMQAIALSDLTVRNHQSRIHNSLSPERMMEHPTALLFSNANQGPALKRILVDPSGF